MAGPRSPGLVERRTRPSRFLFSVVSPGIRQFGVEGPRAARPREGQARVEHRHAGRCTGGSDRPASIGIARLEEVVDIGEVRTRERDLDDRGLVQVRRQLQRLACFDDDALFVGSAVLGAHRDAMRAGRRRSPRIPGTHRPAVRGLVVARLGEHPAGGHQRAVGRVPQSPARRAPPFRRGRVGSARRWRGGEGDRSRQAWWAPESRWGPGSALPLGRDDPCEVGALLLRSATSPPWRWSLPALGSVAPQGNDIIARRA